MRKFLLLAAAAACLSIPTPERVSATDMSPETIARAAAATADATVCGTSNHCTRTVQVGGKCDGQDHLPMWLTPWETRPIRVVDVGVGFDLQGNDSSGDGSRHGYVMIGNSFHTDVMAAMMGAGTLPPSFPQGFYFDFPAMDASAPNDPLHTPHIDAHVSCSGADNFRLLVQIFYEIVPHDVAVSQ